MKIGIEKKIEQLDKFELELLILRLIDVNKEINVGQKTRREIDKMYEQSFLHHTLHNLSTKENK